MDDAEAARRELLRRCVPHADLDDAALVDSLDAEMARQDPGAAIELQLCCPHCGREQAVLFDIVAYLCDEIADWAQQTLADVHLLARAYGWSERDILALTPARRRSYVQMVGA
jgi:hypothetical protein